MLDVNKALDLDPSNAYAFDTRGNIYLKLGLRDQAIADFRKAVALNPNLNESNATLQRLEASR
jgi:Tfp pilus assembly protein PilF